MKKNKNLKVAIIMGSQSDYKTMQLSTKILKKMGIKFETKIISAHRTPKRMYEFASSAAKNNIGVIIMAKAKQNFGTQQPKRKKPTGNKKR